MPKRKPKLFTVEEADALLPQVRELLTELRRLQRTITSTSEQIEQRAEKIAAGNGYPVPTLKTQVKTLGAQQLKLVEAYQGAVKQLEQLGCLVKDLATGLVDFHGLRDGEVVFLCWKEDEAHVAFWHTLENGFASRQPL
jgi:hypothetical protein